MDSQVHFSFHFPFSLLFLYPSYFHYQKSEYSSTRTSQRKRSVFNIRILLEVRSFAAPKICAKKKKKNLLLYRAEVSRGHCFTPSQVSLVISHVPLAQQSCYTSVFMLRLGRWPKAGQEGMAQFRIAVLQGSSAIY